MMNHVSLVGRLTRDPELQYTANGTAVTAFTIAVERNFKNNQGEREADFIRCVAWQKLGEITAEYGKKGRLVGVEGRLQTRTYENNQGRVYVTEVVAENITFLDRPQNTENSQKEKTTKQEVVFQEIKEEDLPF